MRDEILKFNQFNKGVVSKIGKGIDSIIGNKENTIIVILKEYVSGERYMETMEMFDSPVGIYLANIIDKKIVKLNRRNGQMISGTVLLKKSEYEDIIDLLVSLGFKKTNQKAYSNRQTIYQFTNNLSLTDLGKITIGSLFKR